MFAFFERLIDPFPTEAPTQPPKTLYAFCRHYIKGTGLYFICMALLTGLVAAMEVSLFAFLGKIVDMLSTNTPETLFENHRDEFINMGLVLLVALPTTVALNSLLIHQTLLGNFPMKIRWLAHKYLLGQSVSFYQDEFAGRIATKVMQTALAVRETALKLLDVLLYVAVYFTSIVVLVASLDFRLAFPLIAWLAAYLGLLYYFLPRLKSISIKQADARSEMTGRIVDTYTNISTVKLFSHSKRESDYAQESMNTFLSTVYPQMRLATAFNLLVWVANIFLISAMISLSIYLWMNGEITPGAIAAAVAVVLRLFGMSQWVMWEVSALFENMGTATDGMNTIARKREVQDSPYASSLQIEQGAINFDRVRFHYGKGSGVIDDFSLNIKPGEKVGFVGRSGAGKSTLVNLLLRFYDLEGGNIFIDGQDIAKIKQDSLRANIGMVTQDTSLLHRSVRDNLLYGNPNADEKDMLSAASKAKADDFILELEDANNRKAYDAHVGERGVKLSGGQRQRIAIARALLKDAPILILDEATSALDSEVESVIQENLNQLMQGKTVIAIAHRLSTIAALDRLIVLDQGRIIEQGTHAELIDNKGLYAQLWAHQSGGFLGEE